MYQTIVLGLGFLLIIGGGWLIKVMDTEGIISSQFTKPKILNTTSTTTADGSATSSPERNLEGRYLCDSTSGCPNPSFLIITEAGEISMTTSYESGAEMLQEIGTWKNEKNGGASIMITGTDSGIYPTLRLLSIKYVSPTSLSGITFDPSIYKDWVRPVFKKQENPEY